MVKETAGELHLVIKSFQAEAPGPSLNALIVLLIRDKTNHSAGKLDFDNYFLDCLFVRGLNSDIVNASIFQLFELNDQTIFTCR